MKAAVFVRDGCFFQFSLFNYTNQQNNLDLLFEKVYNKNNNRFSYHVGLQRFCNGFAIIKTTVISLFVLRFVAPRNNV